MAMLYMMQVNSIIGLSYVGASKDLMNTVDS